MCFLATVWQLMVDSWLQVNWDEGYAVTSFKADEMEYYFKV
jgi:hypothetical protein